MFRAHASCFKCADREVVTGSPMDAIALATIFKLICVFTGIGLVSQIHRSASLPVLDLKRLLSVEPKQLFFEELPALFVGVGDSISLTDRQADLSKARKVCLFKGGTHHPRLRVN